jgi:uncharacterized protein YbjT (DUF2867 family)
MPGLSVIEGNVLDGGKVMLTLSGADKVFLCLGRTKNNPKDVVSRGTALILQGMSKYKINRIVAVSTMGIRGNAPQAGFLFKIMSATLLKDRLSDRILQEQFIEASPHQWTILRPAQLVDEVIEEAEAFYGDQRKPGKVSRIQIADYALILFEQDQQVKKIVSYSS